MFRKALLALAFALISSSAWAQNTTCSDRPSSDSSNACANTRFVANAVSSGQYITPQSLGFKCVGNPEANILQSVINLLPSYGGLIYLPTGSNCVDTGTVTIGSKTNVTIAGPVRAHGNSAIENDNVAKLTYTGTASRYIDARSTFGTGLINFSLTYSSSSFTGILVDDAGAVVTVDGVYLGTSTNRTGTATLLNLSTTVDGQIRSSFFYHGAPAIKGQSILGQSTVVDFYDNIFSLSDTVPISSCGESWSFRHNSFEPLANGQAGAFINTVGLPCYAMSWTDGNWFGDVTALSGQWIVAYAEGFTYSGNRMAGDLSSASNGISIMGGSGFHISGGNRFEALSTAVNFANPVTGCVVNGDYFAAGVTTKVGGSSNCTNINTNGNSPSTSQFAVNQIAIGQSAADPLPKTLSGAGTLAATGALTLNLAAGATVTGALPNSNLANSATTVNGQTCTLGSTCTVTAAASGVTLGTTTVSGGTSGRVLYDNAGLLGEYTTAQLTTQISLATSSLSGALPAWPNNTTTFFRGDGTYTAVAASALSGLGTGVPTALGTNVGSAGAFVTFNGALGTPSSGTATNLTGTAAGLTAGTASAVAVGGITGLGTGVGTALAVNVGSAGAFVTFNGALGTPSSGVGTNITNVNAATLGGATFAAPGVIGGTTPNTATFTNVTATAINSGGGNLAIGNSGSVTSIPGTTNSTSTTTGALVVAGGLGVAADFRANDIFASRTASTGYLFLGSNGSHFVGFDGTNYVLGGTITSDTATVDNTLCLGSGGQLLKGSGALGVCLGTSSVKFKHDIVAMGAGLAEIVKLTPKNFFYNKGYGDDGKRQQYGFIAEEVVKVLPGVTAPDKEGKPQSVDMLAMVPVLVRSVQQLKAANDNLEARIKELETKPEKKGK